MPGKKISEFQDAVTLQSTDYLILDRGSSTLRLSGGDLATKTQLDELMLSALGIVPSNRGGAGDILGILKANGTGVVSAALSGIDYLTPSSLNALSGYAEKTYVNGISAFADAKFATNTKVDGMSAFVDAKFATNVSLTAYATNTKVDGMSAFTDVKFATNTKVDSMSAFANTKFISNPQSVVGGQVLTYNSSTNTWVASAGTASGVASGDLSGTYPSPTVAKLRGITISTTAPSSGQVLTYNSATGQWVPANITTAPPSLIGDITSVGTTTTYTNVVPANKGGAGTVNGLLKANGSGTVSAAVAGTDYVVPSTLTSYATNAALTNYTPNSALANYATTTSLTSYALNTKVDGMSAFADTKFVTNSVLTNYALNSALANYALISSLTGYATNTKVDSMSAFANVQFAATRTEISKYLPLSGGELTGSILISNNNSTINTITLNAPLSTRVSGGTSVAFVPSLLSVGNVQLSPGKLGSYFGKTKITDPGLSTSELDGSNRKFVSKLVVDAGITITKIASSRDGKFGYAVGYYTSSGSPVMYQTSDFGQTWILNSTLPLGMNKLSVVATNTDGSVVVYATSKLGLSPLFTSSVVAIECTNTKYASVLESSERRLITLPFSVVTEVLDIALSSDARVIAIATSDGLFVSKDFGFNWTKPDTFGYGISKITISSDGKYMAGILLTGAAARPIISSSYGDVFVSAPSSVANSSYRFVDMSADGRLQIALGAGLCFVSNDWGQNWFSWSTIVNTAAASYQVYAIDSFNSFYAVDSSKLYYFNPNRGITTTTTMFGANINHVSSAVSSDGKTIFITAFDSNINKSVIYVSYASSILNGSLTIGDAISASGNIFGSTITGSSLTITGNVSATGPFVGTTVTGSSLTVTGNISAGGSITGSSLTVYGNVSATGDVIGFASLSDKRLKDNITTIPNALDKISAIRGVEFIWNDLQDVYHGHDVGVVAQEIEQVLPQAVVTRDTGYKAVKYDRIIPLLIEAINELKTEVEILRSKK